MIQAINNNNINNNNQLNKYNSYKANEQFYKKSTLKNFASLSYNMQGENFTALPTAYVKAAVKKTTSVWHKYPLKLMVYSNDVGEAARPIIGNTLAKLSLIPAMFYTGFALNAGKKKENLGKEILFQGIASFLMPFLLVKSSRAVAKKGIEMVPVKFRQAVKNETAKMPALDKLISKFSKKNSSGHKNIALTAFSMAALAVGVKPMDEMVKKVLDM